MLEPSSSRLKLHRLRATSYEQSVGAKDKECEELRKILAEKESELQHQQVRWGSVRG